MGNQKIIKRERKYKINKLFIRLITILLHEKVADAKSTSATFFSVISFHVHINLLSKNTMSFYF